MPKSDTFGGRKRSRFPRTQTALLDPLPPHPLLAYQAPAMRPKPGRGGPGEDVQPFSTGGLHLYFPCYAGDSTFDRRALERNGERLNATRQEHDPTGLADPDVSAAAVYAVSVI